jgi:hypothetical protein
MNFSWNASAFKEWCWSVGGMRHATVRKTMRGSIPVCGRLAVNVPFGELRVAGCDGPDAEIEVRVRSSRPEHAEGVSYTTQQRDGETRVSVDGPLSGGGKNFASVEVLVRVPRGVPLEARCGMGAIGATDVGKISLHANMGAIDVDGARAGCDVHANMGAVTVRLAPQWQGEGVTVSTNMGKATLAVPDGVRLDCAASSNMGSVEMKVGSTEGAPPAKVHSNMGSARIVPAR